MSKHRVYDEVDDIGQRTVSVRWFESQKYKSKNVNSKARLVAQEFEEENLYEIRKDSPTCCEKNFRFLLSLIVANKCKIHSLDIKSAFLQGSKIDHEVYFKPPVEAGTCKLWKLNISVYGLYDALRCWYLRLKSVLLRAGATKANLMILYFLVSQ